MDNKQIEKEECYIKAENITVNFKVGDFRNIGLKEYVIQKITGKYTAKEFCAVKNVSFELDKGDFLGIIGRNGSGKTTLLKAVSQVIEPKEGTVYIKENAKISSLLALGTGFDMDLTIKENVYMRGALLGYTKEFLDAKYPEIIEFSELGEFENFKLRQLSSGMNSRLAFSIASLIEPDILILDEVLAVGDTAFRQKSEAKMMEIIRGGAATIMVSHSVAQIRSLATKVIWLNKGVNMMPDETDPKIVCDEYMKFLKAE